MAELRLNKVSGYVAMLSGNAALNLHKVSGYVALWDYAPIAVVSFSADPVKIRKGKSVTLAWDVQNAVSVAIDNGVGSVPASGSVIVTPDASTLYTLTAENLIGEVVTATVSVEVVKNGSNLVKAHSFAY